MRRSTALIAGTLLLLGLGMTPAAQASSYDDANLYSMETCEYPSVSQFKFHLYYNSGQGGSYRNIGYSVYDFDHVYPGGSDPSSHPIKFCIIPGASGYWPGSGQHVKNNAASGENEHYKYWARVYYNSGYKGAQDVMAPYQHIDRFVNVYNENASFRWTS
ncbi:hypothetical protein HUT18_14385 [Streptomyces sp. NA04227]|nr:hypothetical protein HUT18_14385 [Streptomyces sp. NA04227]